MFYYLIFKYPKNPIAPLKQFLATKYTFELKRANDDHLKKSEKLKMLVA
jgi:hypothetical protein